MRVLILGQFGPSQIGRSFAHAFRELGHRVGELDPLDGLEWLTYRIASDRAGIHAGQLVRRRLGARVLERVPQADLIFVIKGMFLEPDFFAALRTRTGGILANFNPDNPFNVNGSSSFRHIVEAIPSFDLYLIWTNALLEPLRNAGARRAAYLPFGSDPLEFHPVALSDEERALLDSPVSFVGNWDPERESWLEAAAEFGLGVWGQSWSRARSPALRRCWRGEAVYGDRLRRVIAAGDIQLNILRAQNKTGHNMRTFELPACGAFQLTERSADLPLLFEEGLEVVSFSSTKELRESIRHYLARPLDRRRIAALGMARALRATYTCRASQIVELLRHA